MPSISTYTKFSEKLKFVTPWYARVRVRIRGFEKSVFRKILLTYLMDDSLAITAKLAILDVSEDRGHAYAV